MKFLTSIFVYGFLGLLLAAVFTTYWIPKKIVVNFMTKYYPEIILNNSNMNTNTNDKSITLSFDDIPYDVDSHKEIIKILDKYNMKAIFFIISDYVKQENRAVLIEAIKNGHMLGNHGKTNSRHAFKSEADLINEIEHCDTLIEDLYDEAGVKREGKIYRPGCGFFTKKMIDIADEKNYTIVLGSVYPHDPIFRCVGLNYRYLIHHIEHNDIIILHDRKWTVPLLERLLPWIIQNNFTVEV